MTRTIGFPTLPLALAFALGGGLPAAAASVTLTIQADHPGPRINPSMWGIFFEDINFGADGGLYAELVKNRAFEFPDGLTAWSRVALSNAAGSLTLRTEEPFLAASPHYLRIQSAGPGPFGVVNEGFRGMGVRQGEEYDFSAQARSVEASPAAVVELLGAGGAVLARAPLARAGARWEKLTATLAPEATEPKARLRLTIAGAGSIDIDMVSLFPRLTWKNRPGGLRADMVQKLADLRPGFLRFPGGCIVEGSDLSRRYQWKNTVGPADERKLLINRWNYEFKHKLTPDYFQTFGLGFFEYFQLCEDIGAQPLPILNCGMACQFNTGQLVPLNAMDPYLEDALDLIEFANGSADSPWGARRAAAGHPAPFNLKLLGVGNEQWGPQYIERYVLFAKALKARYPEVQLVAPAGPSPADDRFQFLWPKLRELNADIVDEHCYANPIWFLSNSDRYDHYDRNGPKVFMGEYAAQSVAICSPDNRNNLECALAEAAYMTGLERNADVVRMASYAPLFANVDAWQWTPDLIWADSLRVYGTPNYYAQQLFMRHRGDVVLPISNTAPVLSAAPAGRIGLGTHEAAAEFKEVRVVRGGESLFSADFAGDTSGWSEREKFGVADNALRQADVRASAMTFAGEPAWSDYTLTLKARKLGGSQGLLILVRVQGAEDYVAWELGGWRNTAHGVYSHLGQQDNLLSRVPGSLETNRWYDVKVELKGERMDCYLDGQRVQSVMVPVRRTPAFFASAARDERTGEVILKAVNPAAEAVEATIQTRGLPVSRGQAVILAGASAADENSFAEPLKVSPRTRPISGVKPDFSYTFQPRSFTVLRLGGSAGP